MAVSSLAQVFLRCITRTALLVLRDNVRLPIVVSWRATKTTFVSVPARSAIAAADKKPRAESARRVDARPASSERSIGRSGALAAIRTGTPAPGMIDASLTCDIHDVAVRGARTGRGGAGHDDHASADVLGAGGIHLDVMHAPVHPVDHQPDPLAHFVAAKPFVEYPPDDALGHLLAVLNVVRGLAVLRQPFALQRPVHGPDDVAALAKLPQHRLGLWRYNPFAGLDLSRQPHALQLACPF